MELFSHLGNSQIYEGRAEPFFVIMISLGILLGLSGASLYALPLAFSIFIKMKVLEIFKFNYMALFFILIFYLTRYFPIHELTQIRVAVACGFILYSMSAKTIFKAIFFSTIAALAHYSAIVVAPFLLYRIINLRQSKSQKVIWLSTYKYRVWLAFAALSLYVIIYYLHDNIDDFITLTARYFLAIEFYQNVGFEKTDLNIFSGSVLLDLMLIIYLVFLNQTPKFFDSSYNFIFIFSIAAFWIFAEYPILAFRLREILSISSVFILAQLLVGTKKQRFIAYIFISLSGAYYLNLHFDESHGIF